MLFSAGIPLGGCGAFDPAPRLTDLELRLRRIISSAENFPGVTARLTTKVVPLHNPSCSLRTQFNACDGVNLKDRRHAALQAGRTWGLPGRVGCIEEQRPFDYDRNRRLIEMISGAG